MGFTLRRYGPNGQDLQSKNLTDNLWDSHGPNGHYLQSNNGTDNVWDCHGHNCQDLQSKNYIAYFYFQIVSCVS